jgi:transcription initiation factor TFIIIB Brf1 subunit/transcription initiation factor TFIIB
MEQAMRKGKFRWGRRAEHVAGASICLALRESGKAELTREVAVRVHLDLGKRRTQFIIGPHAMSPG